MRIDIDDWPNLFDHQRLATGYDYYNDDQIKTFKKSETGIHATVFDTTPHDVTITIDGNAIVDMHCDCEDAHRYQRCAHMAAVLYANANDAFQETDTHDLTNRSFDLTTVVSGTDPLLLQEFLIDLMRHDDQITKRFLKKIGFHFTTADLPYFKKQIDQLIRKLVTIKPDSQDYYWNSEYDDFIEPAKALIQNALDPIIDDYNSDLAFRIACYFIEQLSTIQDEQIQYGIECIYQYLYNLLVKAVKNDLTIEEGALSWLFCHYDSIEFPSYFVDQMVDTFTQSDSIKRIENWFNYQLDKIIQEDIEKQRVDDPFALLYAKLILKYPSITLGIDHIYEKYGQYASIQYVKIRNLLDQHEYLKAQALTLSIRIHRPDHYQRYKRKFDEYLVESLNHYSKNGKLAKKALIELVKFSNGSTIDRRKYLEYKLWFTNIQWSNQRDILIDAFMDKTNIDMIYVEEEMAGPLLALINSTQNASYLLDHTQFLYDHYPNETIALFTQLILSYSKQSGPTKHYQTIAKLLITLRNLPDGTTIVEPLLDQLINDYGNRRIMMNVFKEYKLI